MNLFPFLSSGLMILTWGVVGQMGATDMNMDNERNERSVAGLPGTAARRCKHCGSVARQGVAHEKGLCVRCFSLAAIRATYPPSEACGLTRMAGMRRQRKEENGQGTSVDAETSWAA